MPHLGPLVNNSPQVTEALNGARFLCQPACARVPARCGTQRRSHSVTLGWVVRPEVSTIGARSRRRDAATKSGSTSARTSRRSPDTETHRRVASARTAAARSAGRSTDTRAAQRSRMPPSSTTISGVLHRQNRKCRESGVTAGSELRWSVPNLAVDEELSGWLAEQGHERSPAAVRQWRDFGLLAARVAPGRGTGKGRRRSQAGADDRAVCLALAEALDSPGRWSLAEAAMTAWGTGSPVADPGLRRALQAVLESTSRGADATLARLRQRSRKALSVLARTGQPATVEALLGAALGHDVSPERMIGSANAAGLLPALQEGSLVRDSPGNVPLVMPGMAKVFEGPLQVAALRVMVRNVSRKDLDSARRDARVMLSRREGWLREVGADMPHGLRVAVVALSVLGTQRMFGSTRT